VPCIPHTLFLSPELNEYVPALGTWEAMLGLLDRHARGIVVKPNEGTTGRSVFMVSSKPRLELAVNRIFASHLSLAISPFVDIDDEVRVVLIDDRPLVVYSKNRPSIIGDGKHSLLELALAATPPERRSSVLPGMVATLDKEDLDSGAQPMVLEQGEVREACTAIAIKAANAIGMRFGSVDVVQVDGAWRILEINSGVMMEALSKLHPDLVYAAYSAALDKVFD